MRSALVSWLVLLLAFLLWGGVAWFCLSISSMQEARALKALDAEQAGLKEASLARARALARQTKDSREALEKIASVSDVHFLGAIDLVGKDAGVAMKFGQVLSAPVAGDGSALHSARFVVAAYGTFAEVLHAAALLDSLPLPSFVEQFHFERLESVEEGGPWRLSARIRILTTSDISL